MSGKQYSLDSRIDLAEAVDEVNNEDRDSVEKIDEDEEGYVMPATTVKSRSLSVIENSEVASQVITNEEHGLLDDNDDAQVGMVLRRARVGAQDGQVIHEDHECGDDDEDDCAFFSTILTPNQTAAIVKMIKQV